MDVTVEDCETTYEQVVRTTTTAKNNVCTSWCTSARRSLRPHIARGQSKISRLYRRKFVTTCLSSSVRTGRRLFKERKCEDKPSKKCWQVNKERCYNVEDVKETWWLSKNVVMWSVRYATTWSMRSVMTWPGRSLARRCWGATMERNWLTGHTISATWSSWKQNLRQKLLKKTPKRKRRSLRQKKCWKQHGIGTFVTKLNQYGPGNQPRRGELELALGWGVHKGKDVGRGQRDDQDPIVKGLEGRRCSKSKLGEKLGSRQPTERRYFLLASRGQR